MVMVIMVMGLTKMTMPLKMVLTAVKIEVILVLLLVMVMIISKTLNAGNLEFVGLCPGPVSAGSTSFLAVHLSWLREVPGFQDVGHLRTSH